MLIEFALPLLVSPTLLTPGTIVPSSSHDDLKLPFLERALPSGEFPQKHLPDLFPGKPRHPQQQRPQTQGATCESKEGQLYLLIPENTPQQEAPYREDEMPDAICLRLLGERVER
ncbi:MAG: hypothetical protein HWE25_04515 [Alphaproteobacteria bacterium]|nr:hypothetical protein [Alphaproteobacteria bacterium]